MVFSLPRFFSKSARTFVKPTQIVHRERDRETDRQTDRQTERQRERERERESERERQRENSVIGQYQL